MTDLDLTLEAVAAHAWVVVLLQPKSKNPQSWCEPCSRFTFACKHYPGTRRLTDDPAIVTDWIERHGNLGIVGVNTVMLDFDVVGVLADMSLELGPLLPTVVTGSGKLHAYLEWEPNLPRSIIWRGKTVGQIIRSAGEYVACPPSVHPKTGTAYRWLQDPREPFSSLPPTWRNHLITAAPSAGARGYIPFELPDNIEAGERHRTLFRFVRSWKLAGNTHDETLSLAREVNENFCRPPVETVKLEPFLERCWNLKDRAGFSPTLTTEWPEQDERVKIAWPALSFTEVEWPKH